MSAPRRLHASPTALLPGFVAVFFLPFGPAAAQESTPLPADTASALVVEPERTLRFTTDEGTWISLDVSPDGRHVVFDLLGDLYTIPIDGGRATRVTQGMGFDATPRWSPDGSTIAFISDRDGGDNLWSVRPDGSGLRKITAEVDFALGSPEWTPDGRYLVVRRFGPYPTNENYLTNVPLWMYHVLGGTGTRLFPQDASRKSTNTGAAFSPDGTTLYTASHEGGYAGESLGSYQVLAYDLASGEETRLTSGSGGGLRPIASPDGRWLVYATRAGTRTALRLRDLRSHEDEWLVGETQRDDQEGYAPNDVFPGYAFTPDSRAVVFYSGGKIHRVELDTKEVRNIPFSVDVEVGLGPRLFFPKRIDDGPIPVTQLQFVTESPRGDRLAFAAVGTLWTAPRDGDGVGTPVPLADHEGRGYDPAFSPDGRWVAYATWTDSAGGHLWRTRADGSGAPERLTEEPAFVRYPVWSPEADRIVYSWAPRRAGQGAGPVAPVVELRSVSADGGASSTITRSGARPDRVSAGGPSAGRVYFAESLPDAQPGFNATSTTAVVSVRLDGQDKQTHARITTRWWFSSSALMPWAGLNTYVAPDLRSLLVRDRDDLYWLPMPPAGGEGLHVNLASPSVPLRRITTEGANYAGWVDGGEAVAWSFANHYYRAPLSMIAADPAPETWSVSHAEVSLQVERATPRGEVMLRGARIITMRGDEVIEQGDVLIRDNRIAAVGTALDVPPSAEVIDVRGATIIPGIVDTHAHPKTGAEASPEQEWSVAANLAFGVTTTRNPSGPRGNVAWGELVDAGRMVGSRVYATGPPLTSNTVQIQSYEDALRVVRRYKAQGVHSLKQYLQPRRIQRQWILQAAHAEGMNTTNEGAADLKMDLTMAMDGFTAIEHSIGQVPLYEDVVRLFAEARLAYTPTLGVAYGGPAGDGYWRARVDLDKDPKSAFFTPTEILVSTRRRPMIVEEDYNFPDIARGLRDIVRAGGLGGLGSHGQQDGIAAHWELWMIQSGDMTNMEALRIATILGAESLGFEQDLGSIEVGKLADLVVLDANPLDDIRNSTAIRLVMKNGELYEGDTLDRIWPSPRPFPTPYWVREQQALDALRGGN